MSSHQDAIVQEPSDKSELGLAIAEPANGNEHQPPSDSATWFFAHGSRGAEGPVSFVQLRQRVATGDLTRNDLCWQPGMPEWAPAGNVQGLFDEVPAQLPRRPPPLRQTEASTPTPLAVYAEFVRPLDRVLSQPLFFRTIGRTCAVGSLVVFLGSLLVAYWGYAWFNGAVLLLTIFVLGEATGAILETRAHPPRSSQPDSENGED